MTRIDPVERTNRMGIEGSVCVCACTRIGVCVNSRLACCCHFQLLVIPLDFSPTVMMGI